MPEDHPSGCPATDQIERLVVGELDDENVRLHVESCSACRSKAGQIRANNELLSEFLTGETELGLDPRPTSAYPEIPGYDITSEIHRGGQGVVYKAIQTATRRRVALKMLIRETFATPRQRRRFEREIELAAGLRHPHIVTIYESGSTPDGQAYFAMEYIDGQPLDRALASRRKASDSKEDRVGSVANTLRLFVKICGAVSYAHQQAVIHRDLKPGNILIDAADDPHIVDFGVAKSIGLAALGEVSAATKTGEFLGTFAYAAPEQVKGDSGRVDTRTDVYALGVILYEMLTQAHPYPVNGTLSDTLRHIAETEPKDPATLRAGLDADVSTIVLKALAKEPERRYPSAVELANDVQRYLAGEPIDARRHSTWYVLRKTARRHRGPLLVAAAILALLAGFAVDRGIQVERIARQRDLAQRYATELDSARSKAAIERARTESRVGNPALAEQLLWREHLNPPATLRNGAKRGQSMSGVPVHTHWALWELYSRQPRLATWLADSERVNDVRFNSDGTILASAGDDGVKLWEMPSHRLLRAHEEIGPARTVCFSPDGKLLASGGERIHLWQADDGRLLNVLPARESEPVRVDWSPDGTLLASWASNNVLRLWDVATGQCVRAIDIGGRPSGRIRFSPQGDLLAAPVKDGTIALITVPQGNLIDVLQVFPGGHDMYVNRIAFSPDGETLFAAKYLDVQVWQVATRSRLYTFPAHDAWISSLSLSSNGRRLATAALDQTVRIWDLASDEPTRLAIFYDRTTVGSVQFDPSGSLVASGNVQGAITLWETRPGQHRRILEQGIDVHCVRYSYDGRLLAVSGGNLTGEDWAIRLWDTVAGRKIAALPGHSSFVPAVAFRRDDKVLASASYDKTIRLWDVDSGQCLREFAQQDAAFNTIAFSPDGRLLASGSDDHVVKVWDAETGVCLETFEEHVKRVPYVCFSPDGELLASCSVVGSTKGIGRIVVHHVGSGRVRAVLEERRRTVRALCFRPDGRVLASGSDDGVIKLWDVSTWQCTGSLEGHTQPVYSLSFSPDGHLLASATRGCDLKLWDVASRRCLATLSGHQDMVFSVCFHPEDPTRLASAGRDQTVALWDLAYYDRHIAGNLEYQISRLKPEERDGETVARLRAWARALNAPRPRPPN